MTAHDLIDVLNVVDSVLRHAHDDLLRMPFTRSSRRLVLALRAGVFNTQADLLPIAERERDGGQ